VAEDDADRGALAAQSEVAAPLSQLAVRRHDLRQAPGAVVPLAGIRAGGGEQSRSLPRVALAVQGQHLVHLIERDLLGRGLAEASIGQTVQTRLLVAIPPAAEARSLVPKISAASVWLSGRSCQMLTQPTQASRRRSLVAACWTQFAS
jgi:hypothetical protein